LSTQREITLRISGDGRADVEIRLPPVNVLGVEDLERLSERIAGAVEARVLVLSGLPRAFSAGVSIEEHDPEPEAIDRMLATMRGVLETLVGSPAVTIAAVSGACLGGGAEIAAACDFVIAAEDARIGFPEIRLACFPPGATALLPNRIGEVRAADWILTGRTLSGREAAASGFAARAVDRAALPRETDRLAEELLSRSPRALAAALRLIRRGRREALAAVLPRAEDAYRALEGDASLRSAVQDFRKSRGAR
jgi:cyclohexa-1,5-dienecarbonyl-CoA hydratase